MQAPSHLYTWSSSRQTEKATSPILKPSAIPTVQTELSRLACLEQQGSSFSRFTSNWCYATSDCHFTPELLDAGKFIWSFPKLAIAFTLVFSVREPFTAREWWRILVHLYAPYLFQVVFSLLYKATFSSCFNA